MTVAAHLNALFSTAQIILWVEDSTTRDYLTKAWGDPPEFAFFLAGGNEAVRPIVDAARRENIGHVFGLVDRDFRTSNRPQWGNPAVTVFRLPRHEIENYQIDATALANGGLNNRARTLPQIQAEIERLADLQPCWMACRHVISQLRTAVTDDFPLHPAVVHAQTEALAEAHIRNSPWFVNLPPTVGHWTAGATLTNAIHAAHTDMQTHRQNGTWIVEFSGKEIFRPVRDYIYNPPPGTNPDSDLAQAVGIWQEQHNAVPQDLRDLRSALRQRVGLPP